MSTSEPENNGLSQKAARSILKLKFDESNIARMNELAKRKQEGLLGPEERQELEEYAKVGDLLSLLHQKGRKSLEGL